jgi:Zn-dependent oligopeptidase
MIQVQLRHKYARLLGYSNYADYVVDLRMAKTPSKVYIMFPFFFFKVIKDNVNLSQALDGAWVEFL